MSKITCFNCFTLARQVTYFRDEAESLRNLIGSILAVTGPLKVPLAGVEAKLPWDTQYDFGSKDILLVPPKKEEEDVRPTTGSSN